MCEDSKTVFENSKKSKFVLEQIWRKKIIRIYKICYPPHKESRSMSTLMIKGIHHEWKCSTADG